MKPDEKLIAAPDKLVADPKRTKMVALKVKRPLHFQGKIHDLGATIEVSDDEAIEYTRKNDGNYSFSGERDLPDTTRHNLARAERI